MKIKRLKIIIAIIVAVILEFAIQFYQKRSQVSSQNPKIERTRNFKKHHKIQKKNKFRKFN